MTNKINDNKENDISVENGECTQEAYNESDKKVNAGVQCQLLPRNTTNLISSKHEQKFDISNAIARRRFVRRVYALLIVQNLISIPTIEIIVYNHMKPVSPLVLNLIEIFTLTFGILMYIFRDVRRRAPMNHIVFILITIIQAITEGLCATIIGTQWSLLCQAVFLAQALILIAYSKQDYLKFTNFSGMLLMTIIYGIYVVVIIFCTRQSVYAISSKALLSACYVIYDTHLMLTGYHGYNLAPNEYLFAAANYTADAPKIMWEIFKFIFLEHLIKMIKFLANCCRAEVC